MKERGLTHKQIAELASDENDKCPVSVISDWVGANGATPSDLMRVSRLATALGVSFQWLLLSQRPGIENITLADVFEEIEGKELSGYYKIEIKKLKPKK